MNCPYCGKEMKKGVICGDGRSKVRWFGDGEETSLLDKLVTEKGCLSNVDYSLTEFRIEGWYCPDCHKMIFDTDISK